MRLRLEEQTMRRALGASSFLTRNEGKAISRTIGAARQSTINAAAYV